MSLCEKALCRRKHPDCSQDSAISPPVQQFGLLILRAFVVSDIRRKGLGPFCLPQVGQYSVATRAIAMGGGMSKQVVPIRIDREC